LDLMFFDEFYSYSNSQSVYTSISPNFQNLNMVSYLLAITKISFVFRFLNYHTREILHCSPEINLHRTFWSSIIPRDIFNCLSSMEEIKNEKEIYVISTTLKTTVRFCNCCNHSGQPDTFNLSSFNIKKYETRT
jgi:hypothetical protein